MRIRATKRLVRWAMAVGVGVALAAGMTADKAEAKTEDGKVPRLLQHELCRQRVADGSKEHRHRHGQGAAVQRSGGAQGPGLGPRRAEADSADERDDRGRRGCHRGLPDLADGAQQGHQERVQQGRGRGRDQWCDRTLRLCREGRWRRARRLPHPVRDRPNGRQGQYCCDYRRARCLLRRGPPQGLQAGRSPVSRGQRAGRARRHVEPLRSPPQDA